MEYRNFFLNQGIISPEPNNIKDFKRIMDLTELSLMTSKLATLTTRMATMDQSWVISNFKIQESLLNDLKNVKFIFKKDKMKSSSSS